MAHQKARYAASLDLATAGLVGAVLAILPMDYYYYAALKGFYFFTLCVGLIRFVGREGWREWWVLLGAIAVLLNNPFLTLEMPKWVWGFSNFFSTLAVLVLMDPSDSPAGHSQHDH